MTKQLSIFFASLAVIFLSACGQGDVLRVDEVVVNLSPVDGNPSSGYMTIHGGPEDVSLVGVIADDVMRMEMHETVEKDGMAQMQTLKEVPVPAGDKVKFEPGGKHLMIWGVGGGSIHRGSLRMIFIFSNDDRIQVDGIIKQVGGAKTDKPEADTDADAETSDTAEDSTS